MIAAGVAAVVGVIGLLAWAFVAAADMPSYLAGWLLGMAVPVGMLPIVMGLEAAGLLDWPVLAVLRRTLFAACPLGAVLAIPVAAHHRAAVSPARHCGPPCRPDGWRRASSSRACW